MATPSEGYPNWATNEITEVVDGKTYANKVSIPDGIKDDGLKYEEPAARQWINQNFNLIRKWVEELDIRTTGGSVQLGWYHYIDTQYTEGSPFVVNDGVTSDLHNNAGTIISDGAPTSGDQFYDGTEFIPNNSGDAYTASIRMMVEGSANDSGLALRLDIGDGSPEIILGDSRRLIRGAGNPQPVQFDFTYYSLDTFVTNGGKLTIEAVDGNISVWDINFMIQRTFHKDNS